MFAMRHDSLAHQLGASRAIAAPPQHLARVESAPQLLMPGADSKPGPDSFLGPYMNSCSTSPASSPRRAPIRNTTMLVSARPPLPPPRPAPQDSGAAMRGAAAMTHAHALSATLRGRRRATFEGRGHARHSGDGAGAGHEATRQRRPRRPRATAARVARLVRVNGGRC